MKYKKNPLVDGTKELICDITPIYMKAIPPIVKTTESKL